MRTVEITKGVLASLDNIVRGRGSKGVKLVTEVDAKLLRRLLAVTPGVEKVQIQKNGDVGFAIPETEDATLLMKPVTPTKLVLVGVFPIQKGKEVPTLLATMIWNDNKLVSHNTGAYITLKNLCTLESHLPLDGGVTTEHIDAWIRGFVQAVRPFESTLTSIVEKYDTLGSMADHKGFPEVDLGLVEFGASVVAGIIQAGIDAISE